MIAYMSGSAREIDEAAVPLEWWQTPVQGVIPQDELTEYIQPIAAKPDILPIAIGSGILGLLALVG